MPLLGCNVLVNAILLKNFMEIYDNMDRHIYNNPNNVLEALRKLTTEISEEIILKLAKVIA